MSELQPARQLIGLVGLAPFAPLGVAAVLTVLGTADADRPTGPTIALTVVAAGWAGLLLCHRRWADRLGYRLGYFVGLLVVMAVLTAWSPWYALASWVVFPQALLLFPSSRGALAGVAAACVISAGAPSLSPTTGWPEPTYPLLISLVLPLLAVGWVAGRENDQRRVLLRELAATQQELVDQAHRTGVAEERARITGDLHDTLAQALTATVARLEAAGHSTDEEDRRHQLERAAAAARDGLAESRRTLRATGSVGGGVGLPDGPGTRSERTIADALRSLETLTTEAGSTKHIGPSIRVEISGSGVAPARVEHALSRVASEAVANAVRHARATSVHVSLTWLDDLVLVDVTDDGVGFRSDGDPTAEPAGWAADGHELGRGLGLELMRVRIREVGGELIVRSAPGEGTTISASVPLPSPPSAPFPEPPPGSAADIAGNSEPTGRVVAEPAGVDDCPVGDNRNPEGDLDATAGRNQSSDRRSS